MFRTLMPIHLRVHCSQVLPPCVSTVQDCSYPSLRANCLLPPCRNRTESGMCTKKVDTNYSDTKPPPPGWAAKALMSNCRTGSTLHVRYDHLHLGLLRWKVGRKFRIRRWWRKYASPPSYLRRPPLHPQTGPPLLRTFRSSAPPSCP